MLIVGAVATIVACIAAPFTCGASSALIAIGTTLAKIALGTAIGAAVSLAIGGTIAGIQSALTGHGFWQAFGESVCENFVDAVVTSFAISAVAIAASNALKAFKCLNKNADPFEVEIRQADPSDFTQEAWDRVQSLSKDAKGNTVSSIKDGKAIHNGFMKGQRGFVEGGGPKGGNGLFDGYNSAKKIVYELKPNNSANIRYQRALIARGRQASKLVLVLY